MKTITEFSGFFMRDAMDVRWQLIQEKEKEQKETEGKGAETASPSEAKSSAQRLS